jgi:FtsP/CotA-like multicopper oxidase with cupredoxin domain
MSSFTRRDLLRGAAGLGGAIALGSLAACSDQGGLIGPAAKAVSEAEAERRRAGGAVINARLTAQPTMIDLGGRQVSTWAYGDSVPGPALRANAGDVLRVTLSNQLAVDTSVHWHGIALRNDMDGVPGITQNPIAAGSDFSYDFTVPDPGTYFYHPHSGVQLDRGLYGVLVVDDPAEPGDYDDEWIVVLDDWLDGIDTTPDAALEELRSSPGNAMGGMDHSNMGGMHGMGGEGELQSPILGGAGDISYPYYLINGRTTSAPHSWAGRPGDRVRLRIVNAGSDTAFRIALGGHRMSVTHSDGFPVVPVEADALMIGMGERFDVTVTLGDGVFPLVASAEGKSGQAMALVRTSPGAAPESGVWPSELSGKVLLGTDLVADESARLTQRPVARRHNVLLSGSMAPYRWTINCKTFPDADPLTVFSGERVRMRFTNMSMMFHPMHVHGHTFGLVQGGARKDTVIVRPMQSIDVDLDADNPGQWATHCHNIYHAESGMMTTLSYRESGDR